MILSIIIPSYNEAKTLPILLKRIDKIKLNIKYEIILIDDGSTDNTSSIIEKLQKKKIKIIRNSQNKGKGFSIREALKEVKGQIVLIQDADLEYLPSDIPKLLTPFKSKNINVVYGSRILKKNPKSSIRFYLGGRLLTLVTNILYKASITDEATGYKAFRKKTLNSIKLKSNGFEFCPEVTAKLLKKGERIFEVPINYKPRKAEQKKIKWHDGIKAIFYLIKYKFTN